MRNIQLILCTGLLLVAGGLYDASAQDAAAPAKEPEKNDNLPVAGKPEVKWFEQRKMTVASVAVYLVGEWADIRESKDVLQLVVRFRSSGRKVTQPSQAELGITSYSPKPKYATDHKLTLIADGQTILSQEVPATPGGINSEYFRSSVSYQDFARFANAKRAVLKFGGTTVELTEEMSKSLRDLDAKIER